MNHLLRSFLLLLMELCRSSLFYAVIKNILRTYFFDPISHIVIIDIFKNINLGVFSTFTINIRLYITCANEVNNFKALMLSLSSISVLLLVFPMYYFPLSNIIFSTHC